MEDIAIRQSARNLLKILVGCPIHPADYGRGSGSIKSPGADVTTAGLQVRHNGLEHTIEDLHVAGVVEEPVGHDQIIASLLEPQGNMGKLVWLGQIGLEPTHNLVASSG